MNKRGAMNGRRNRRKGKLSGRVKSGGCENRSPGLQTEEENHEEVRE